MYTTQVKTAALPVARWLDAYCRPERFRDACQACPDYGKVWSCPPGVPDARTAFAPFPSRPEAGSGGKSTSPPSGKTPGPSRPCCPGAAS